MQQILETTASKILQRPIKMIGSGRTDSGVHALGQVAHFHADSLPEGFLYSLNALLPPDIYVLSCLPTDLHARYNATGKIYRYLIDTRPSHDPLRFGQMLHHPRPLDIEAMREAALHFIGVHDFASVANVGSSARTTVRHVRRLDITEKDGILTLEFEGNGFLYKMVRNIVGLLLEVGRGRPIDCAAILAARNRRSAGRPAPACGLYLVSVNYSSANEPMRSTPESSLISG